MPKGFTPGPRSVGCDDDEDGQFYYPVHGTDYEWVANFRKKADAQLDAAAPDLLAALIRISQLRGSNGADAIAREALAKVTVLP